MRRVLPMRGAKVIAGVATLAGAFVLGIATAAWAVNGNGSIAISTDGASYVGQVYWNPNGTNHGGMETYGDLSDTGCDSSSVYMKGQVSGYDYTTLWSNSNGCGTSVYGDRVVYDPAATMVNYGNIGVCRDDWVDNCATQYRHR